MIGKGLSRAGELGRQERLPGQCGGGVKVQAGSPPVPAAQRNHGGDATAHHAPAGGTGPNGGVGSAAGGAGGSGGRVDQAI